MKQIVFKVMGYSKQFDPETGEWKQTESLATVEMPYCEENEATAQSVAYNGEYTIEDDGLPEPQKPETTGTAEMAAAILEGVNDV